MKHLKADIVIAGGGTGGVAAALAAAQLGKTVIMSEETDWIGGQLTSQAVPPDENPWVESFGCTRSYQEYRQRVRDYYRRNFPLSAKAKASQYLNPGSAHVSRIAHDPRISVRVLQDMLTPYICNGQIVLLLRYRPVAADVVGDKIRSLTLRSLDGEGDVVVEAKYFVDATELGDVLPISGAEYVTGAESQKQTGEPHAVSGDPEPLNMQAITYCLAMEYLPGENHVIDKPEQYEFWRSYQAPFWPSPLLSWNVIHPETLEPRSTILFQEEASPGRTYSLWSYRRLIAKDNFEPGFFRGDISVMNWPQTDYWLGPIIDVDEEEKAKHIEAARQLSLSMLYWLQTEAPRPDGGTGYPGLRLRPDVMGTADGLAKYPYIRESRRIRAEFTVLEQHIAQAVRGEHGAERFPDSVGIGYFRIDLHPSTGQVTYIDIPACPYQIPLGALIPVRLENLLAGAKNLGVTHITNGAFRLHPVEWNIGEVAGSLAAWCIDKGLVPRQVRNDSNRLSDFQALLQRRGIPLEWPPSVPAIVPSGEYGAGDSNLNLT